MFGICWPVACLVLASALLSPALTAAQADPKAPQHLQEQSVLGLSLSGLVQAKTEQATQQSLIPEGTGLLGKTLDSKLVQGQAKPSLGAEPPMLSLPGIGMPITSMGGVEDGQLPLGGISSFDSKDGFPPFYAGPDQGQASQNPLVGSWGADNLALHFEPSGSCVLEANGRKINGRWQARGQELVLILPNGQKCRLIYSIQGRTLVLSDGSRLQRRGEMPQSNVAFPSQPQSQGALEGFWVASDGRQTLVMAFMNGVCGLNINGQQVYGPYTVSGNRLHVQFSNGQVLDLTFAIEGNTLRFSDGTVLARQAMPQMPAQPQNPQNPQNPQMPQGFPQNPQPQPQPQSPQPQPQAGPNVPWGPATPAQAPQSDATVLEGAWSTQLPNGVQMVFIFKGNQYLVLANGQQSEAGLFRLQGQNLEYQTTAGQSAGQKGVNTWQLQGNILILTFPNGSSLQFTRAS
ncbi:MAG: hypothetical protein K6G15_08655 [Desulfovibrio sp.]|nr:hypothetical protein [Desulfovibrio sp.]